MELNELKMLVEEIIDQFDISKKLGASDDKTKKFIYLAIFRKSKQIHDGRLLLVL